MDIKIDFATIADFDSINSIVKEGHDQHFRALPHIFRKVEQVMPYDYFHSLLSDSTSEILVARQADEVVSFAVLEIIEAPPFNSLTPRKFAYINDFGVASKYNRMGIGKKTFDACIDWAKSKGANALELNVWEFNKGAISFYESLGMQSVSRKMAINLVE